MRGGGCLAYLHATTRHVAARVSSAPPISQHVKRSPKMTKLPTAMTSGNIIRITDASIISTPGVRKTVRNGSWFGAPAPFPALRELK